MSKQPFRDMMRVRVTDLEGHLIRVLDLRIEHDVVLQGSVWKPGVVLPDSEHDLEAQEICGTINEAEFDIDEDGVPIAACGDLVYDNEACTARWTACRTPLGTPRPDLEEWRDRSELTP